MDLYSVMGVSNRDKALKWYGVFFGRSADEVIGKEYLRKIGENAWVVVDDRDVRAERVGGAMITFGVSDLDDFLTRLAANGIAHERPETYSNGARHVVVLDPDGNSLSLAEEPAQWFTKSARAGSTCGSLVSSETDGVGDPPKASDRAPLSPLLPDCILTGNPIPFDVAPGNRWNGPCGPDLPRRRAPDRRTSRSGSG